MTFNNNDLILVDFTARIKDTGEIFDTTHAETALEAEIHEDGKAYRPALIAIGNSWVLKGLDERLTELDVGDQATIEIEPDKAFGPKDAKKVRMIPLRKLGEDAEKISVGDMIEDADGRKGRVMYIGSGRVRVDYNHRYAGKTIIYDVNVLEVLTDNEKKIQHLIRKQFGRDLAYDADDDQLYIDLLTEMFRLEGLSIQKRLLSMDIFNFIPTIRYVTFSEEYENPNPVLSYNDGDTDTDTDDTDNNDTDTDTDDTDNNDTDTTNTTSDTTDTDTDDTDNNDTDTAPRS